MKLFWTLAVSGAVLALGAALVLRWLGAAGLPVGRGRVPAAARCQISGMECGKVFAFTLLFRLAVFSGVGLAVLSYPIMNILYPNSNEAGPGLLSIMGVASFFVCLVLMENAILQASGKEKLTMITLISGGIIKIVVNWFLVAQRSINIYGAPVGTLVSYLFMAALDFVFMCVTLKEKPKALKVFAGPMAAGLLMAATAWAVYGLAWRFYDAGSYFGMLLSMALSIAAAVLVYAVSVIAMRVITKEDMSLIPGGAKIAKILHMR